MIETKQYSDGTVATGLAPLPDQSPREGVMHDWPACATFRGGKCSCDEADKLCPQCGTEEWDRITNRVSPGEVFNRCCRCDHQWAAK